MNNTPQKFEALKGQVESWRAELSIPGTAFGILLDNETYTSGSGITSAKHPLLVTDETLFQIGSITKTVTATAMMVLVEQGKLDLDATVQTYLPDFRVADQDVSQQVTVRHLVTHSAGWVGDVFIDTGTNDDALQQYIEKMAELEQLAPLDTAISYNNSAFCVAGRVIEAITGQTFEQAMQELVFDKLGLDRCFFYPRDVMLHRFVVGHRVPDDDSPDTTEVLSPWPIPRASNAAGGITCDIKNLLRYAQFHLGDGAPILKSESLQQMHTARTYINDYLGSIGLAWFINDVGGLRTLSHSGGTIGQISLLVLVPEHNAAFAITTNAENGGALTAKFSKYVLKEFFGIDSPEPQVIPSTLEQLTDYVGTYSRPMMDIELSIDNEELYIAIKLKGGLPSDSPAPSPPPAPIARCGEDQLLVLDGKFKNVRADVLRDSSGRIQYLRLGSRINPKVK